VNKKKLPLEIPVILDETENYAVIYKPPGMHCTGLKKRAGIFENETLLDWYASIFPNVININGRQITDGGLVHRLDFETKGLVLFAKNQQTLDNILKQQAEGKFIKEYTAFSTKKTSLQKSFPEPPFVFLALDCIEKKNFVIESFFRPFGPGRKQVRPVINEKGNSKNIAKDRDAYYRTEVVNAVELKDCYNFTIRLQRGFRHQIRCHLTWIGCPVLNDPLYSGQPVNGFLALEATALTFTDPDKGIIKRYCLDF